MLFHTRFHPEEFSDRLEKLLESLTSSLESIPSADHDRIIRMYMLLISKTA